MTRPVTARDRERGEEDSVLSLLRIIYRIADSELARAFAPEAAFRAIRGWADQAITQIEAYSKAPGHKDWELAISEKRRELEQQSADLGRWPGDPPQSDSDFTRDTCTTAD